MAKQPESKTKFPLADELSYVVTLAGIGAIFAYVSWAFTSWLRPDLAENWAKWSFVGGGLGGVFGLTWVITEAALH